VAPFDLDYPGLLSDLGVRATFVGTWAYVGSSARKYGWKLHLTATHASFERLLRGAVPILRDRAPFKVIAAHLAALNEGLFGRTQVGKVVTVYPHDDESAVDLAQLLGALDVEGPAVITDLHLGGAVYARYGAFSPDVVEDLFGQRFSLLSADVLDTYQVPFRPPSGVK